MPRFLLLLTVVALLAPRALAQTCTTEWASAQNGVWSDDANWTNGSPSGSATACITQPGTYTVTLDENRDLGQLILGGTSGTQTLQMSAFFVTLGSGTIGPNAVVDIPSGFSAGLLEVTGTLTVEGTLINQSNSGLMTTGGTLEVMPSGTFLLEQPETSSQRSGVRGDAPARFIIRGLLRFDAETPSEIQSTLQGILDLHGGTVEVPGGEARFNHSGGTWTGATFSVAEDARLLVFVGGNTSPIRASGTLSGDIEGTLRIGDGTIFSADPGGLTLDIGGTGMLMQRSVHAIGFLSSGGTVINTGLIRLEPNSPFLSQVTFINRGTFRVERTSVTMLAGAVFRNEPEGTLDMVHSANFQGGEGRVDNAGLILARRAPGLTGGSVSFSQQLVSRPGSEIRMDDIQLRLDAPGSATLPAGARLTGGGRLVFQHHPADDYLVEGTISLGTEATPIDTVTQVHNLAFSRFTGSPRLVVDVDAGGVSDRIEDAIGSTELWGTLVVRVREGYTPQPGDTFTILEARSNILGRFGTIVPVNAPDGIAFVAETSEDNSRMLVRAVAVETSGDFRVSTDAILGGGTRSVFLSGPGVGDVTAARLECAECLDEDDFGTLPATISDGTSFREIQVDVTSPRAYGFYELVLERTAQPDTMVALTVRPYLSFISFLSGVDRGVGVRPAGLRYNWSELTVTNTSNTDVPGFMVGAVSREAPDKVDIALASSNTFAGGAIYHESETADDPDAAALVLGSIVPGQNSRLAYGQRIDPSDVLFPEQARTGPDDDRIPFQGDLVFSGLVAHHLSFERTVGLVMEALEGTGDATLDGYLSDLETADPGAVQRSVRLALIQAPNYTLGPDLLFDAVLDRFSEVLAPPSGLEAVTGAFERGLDEAAGDHLLDIYEAHEVDLGDAPAAVRQLLADEFEALGGMGAVGGASASRMARQDSRVGVCDRGRGNDGGNNPTWFGPPIGDGPGSPPFLASLSQYLSTEYSMMKNNERDNRPITIRRRELDALVELCKVNRRVSPRKGGATQSIDEGTCEPLGPPPPGGPPGGGGGACGGPSAPADPNDKTVFAPQYRCEFGTVVVDGEEISRCVRYFVPVASATAPIVYTLDFENLPIATANAEFVTITDELDPNLDPSTLEVYTTSSDSTFSYTVSGQTVTFRFVGIDLPPNVTDPEGTGFVTFGVQPRAGLETGTEIRNDASIVFDFNPPIETPEVIHEIRETADLAVALAVPDVERADQPVTFRAVVVNAQGDLATKVAATISLPIAPTSVSVPDGECTGTTTLTCTFEDLEAENFWPVDITLPSVPSGESDITIVGTTSAFDAFAANDRETVRIQIVDVSSEDEGDALTTARLALPAPNPTRGPVTLRWGLPAAGRAHVRVFDLLGREVAEITPDGEMAGGWHEMRWTPSVASGVYVIRLDAEVGGQPVVRTRRLVVVR